MNKQIFLSKNNRKICGVCGGIGEYFNVDPTLIRLLVFIAMFFSCGTATLFYVGAAIIIPEQP